MTPNSKTEKAQPTSLVRFVPILAWLPKYHHSWLSLDIIAGLTLWGLVVPEAMAYAGIAGLPPQAGLYTLLAALLVYAILGTSPHLVVSATSATAALLASSVAAALENLDVELERRSVELWIARANEPLRDLLQVTGLTTRIGNDNIFMSVRAAVTAYHARFRTLP
jgi:MFS superfamily sulfate permease-like transporter